MTSSATTTQPSIRSHLFAIAALWLAAAAPASAAPDPAAAALAALQRGETADAPPLAGLAAVVLDARTGRARAYAAGAAELAPDGRTLRPLTADSAVRIASVSKLVTALAALRLVEAGRLDLDRDVRGYGLDVRNGLAPDAPVTLRMLLSHRSGLSDGDRFTVPLGGRTADILAPGGARWASPPGLRFEYSNAGYGLAGAVIEAAGGDRFDRLARRLVLEPLRLDAGFNWQGVSAAGRAGGATLYRRRDADGRWGRQWLAQVDAPGTPPRAGCPVSAPLALAPCDLAGYRPGDNGFLFSPQGGLRISVADLARLGAALMRPRRAGEAPGRGALLRPAEHAALFRATPAAAGLPPRGEYAPLMLAYGLGLQCLSGSGRPAADQPLSPRASAWCGHLGDAYGLTSGLWIDRAGGRVHAYAVTGVGDDPAKFPGRASRFQAWEEAILRQLAR